MGRDSKVTYRYNKQEDEELALEEFLFGSGAAVTRLLANPGECDTDNLDIAELVKQADAAAADGESEGEDVELFVEDRTGAVDAAGYEQQGVSDEEPAGPGPGSRRAQQQEAAEKGKKRGRAPVWEDPADADISVQVAAAPRLRKLRQSKGQSVLTGSEYEAALRRQHRAMHSRTNWALGKRQQQQQSGKAAGAGTEIDEQHEPDEETATQLLRSGNSVLSSSAGGAGGSGGLLAPGSLELSRLRDGNGASPSDAVVQAVQFHPNGQLMLTAGFDKRLKLFQVDGLRNPLVQSLFLQDCPIHSAVFAAGGEIVVAAGRRPFYYIADLHSSRLERVTAPPSLYHLGSRATGPIQPAISSKYSRRTNQKALNGSAAGMKSCESFAASPDAGRPLLAFLGDGGHVGLVSLKSRAPVGSLKMNGSARAAVFSNDGTCIITAGSDGVLYTWDLRSQRCLQQQRDEGAIDCTALALSPDGNYLATGGSSGVVSVYKRPTGLLSPLSDPLDVRLLPSSGLCVPPTVPKPLKALMNLTTTIDTLSFNHDSQMLLMGSRLKKEALRLVHLPSLTVFSNWPTSKSPLHYVHSAAFSPHSGFLSVGNAKGRVLLYRLHHYPEV